MCPFYYLVDMSKIVERMENSVDRNQTLHSVAFDLGLHCLLRFDYPNKKGTSIFYV